MDTPAAANATVTTSEILCLPRTTRRPRAPMKVPTMRALTMLENMGFSTVE